MKNTVNSHYAFPDLWILLWISSEWFRFVKNENLKWKFIESTRLKGRYGLRNTNDNWNAQIYFRRCRMVYAPLYQNFIFLCYFFIVTFFGKWFISIEWENHWALNKGYSLFFMHWKHRFPENLNFNRWSENAVIIW